MYTVKKLSEISGISIRTLHFYHEIGLFVPTKVKGNGYRYYDDTKIIELQQILFFRELGYKLEEITEIVKKPGYSVKKSLIKQKELLMMKKERLEKIIKLIDKTIGSMEGELIMDNREYFEELSDEKIKEYTRRAKKEYGEAVIEKSIENVERIYGKDYYSVMQKQFIDWLNSIRDNMDKGHESHEIQTQIEIWHKFLNQIFDCPKDVFMGMAHLYRDNEEFAVNFRKVHESMPEFVYKAIEIYCSK